MDLKSMENIELSVILCDLKEINIYIYITLIPFETNNSFRICPVKLSLFKNILKNLSDVYTPRSLHNFLSLYDKRDHKSL